MRGLLNCCYELMELELRAQHTENLFTLLHMAEMIDLLCSGGIMEERYSEDQPRDDHGRWTSGGGAGSSFSDSSFDDKEITNEVIERVPKLAAFDDEAKNARYQQANKDLLEEAQKHPVGIEVSRVYDENMNPIENLGYKVGKKAGQVPIDNPEQPYHAFHNHPSGSTLSPDDVFGITERKNMLSLTAIGNNSSIFCIQKELNANSAGYNDFLMNKFAESRFLGGTFSYLDVKEFDMSALPDEFRIPLQKEISDFCNECIQGGQQYGFNYTYSGAN